MFSFASLNRYFSFFTRFLIVHFKIYFSLVRSKWIQYCGNQERFSMRLQSLCCFSECSIYNVWSLVCHWNNETDTQCDMQIEKNAFRNCGTDNNMVSSYNKKHHCSKLWKNRGKKLLHWLNNIKDAAFPTSIESLKPDRPCNLPQLQSI